MILKNPLQRKTKVCSTKWWYCRMTPLANSFYERVTACTSHASMDSSFSSSSSSLSLCYAHDAADATLSKSERPLSAVDRHASTIFACSSCKSIVGSTRKQHSCRGPCTRRFCFSCAMKEGTYCINCHIFAFVCPWIDLALQQSPAHQTQSCFKCWDSLSGACWCDEDNDDEYQVCSFSPLVDNCDVHEKSTYEMTFLLPAKSPLPPSTRIKQTIFESLNL